MTDAEFRAFVAQARAGVAAAWLNAAISMLTLSACAPKAADIGPAGALRVVREHMSSDGLRPDDYEMRVEEEPCEVGGGRCYYVAVLAQGLRKPRVASVLD